MPRFLNRLLALPIDERNEVFAQLEQRIDANIEQAMEAGTFEQGVETVRADSLKVALREVLQTHERTGVPTELVEIVRRDRLQPMTGDTALRRTNLGPLDKDSQAAPAGKSPGTRAPNRLFCGPRLNGRSSRPARMLPLRSPRNPPLPLCASPARSRPALAVPARSPIDFSSR